MILKCLERGLLFFEMEVNNDKTRVFIAIDISREVIKEIERVQNEIKKKNMFIGKFVEGENLHLTLKFLGEISLEDIEKVKLKLKKIKFPKFQAYLEELGVFSSDYIRIIWVHILNKKIEELQGKIDEVLKEDFKRGLPVEGKLQQNHRFMSHLTIARVKSVKDRKLFLEELKKIKVQSLEFAVDKFYLMKSELKPEGPVYTILENFELNL
jgi:RNA 2',3'-cyclic 3'-phosphodiesterase